MHKCGIAAPKREEVRSRARRRSTGSNRPRKEQDYSCYTCSNLILLDYIPGRYFHRELYQADLVRSYVLHGL